MTGEYSYLLDIHVPDTARPDALSDGTITLALPVSSCDGRGGRAS